MSKGALAFCEGHAARTGWHPSEVNLVELLRNKLHTSALNECDGSRATMTMRLQALHAKNRGCPDAHAQVVLPPS